jgi:hypothetical protein
MEKDNPEVEQLKQALVEAQTELGSAAAGLIRPPIRPLRILFDRKWLEGILQPSYVAGREVVRRFAIAAGVDEPTAESRVRPLLSEVGELMSMEWDEPALRERREPAARPESDEVEGRRVRLREAAIDALTHFYLEGGTDDELFAETRRAWSFLESQRRRPDRIAARARYWSTWRRWGAAQEA